MTPVWSVTPRTFFTNDATGCPCLKGSVAEYTCAHLLEYDDRLNAIVVMPALSRQSAAAVSAPFSATTLTARYEPLLCTVLQAEMPPSMLSLLSTVLTTILRPLMPPWSLTSWTHVPKPLS